MQKSPNIPARQSSGHRHPSLEFLCIHKRTQARTRKGKHQRTDRSTHTTPRALLQSFCVYIKGHRQEHAKGNIKGLIEAHIPHHAPFSRVSVYMKRVSVYTKTRIRSRTQVGTRLGTHRRTHRSTHTMYVDTYEGITQDTGTDAQRDA